MRVLLVNNLYGTESRGGAESVVRAEAEALVGLGHEVAVVSIADSETRTEAGPVKSFAYRPPNLFGYTALSRHGYFHRLTWHFLDMFNAGSARRFGRIVGDFRPDVVHTHNLMGLGFLIPAELRLRRIRHIHTVHDVQLIHPSGLLPVGPAGGLPKLSFAAKTHAKMMRRLMGSPQVVVFPSEFMKTAHRRFGFFPRSKLEVIRNPAPAPSEKRGDQAKVRFLFAGQLEGHKGIMTLLDAWESGGFDGRAELRICGSGSLEQEAKRRVAGITGVSFLGRLDMAALLEEMGRASFVVVPSLVIENAPAVIMEGMSRGTPVIAARSGGIPELVKEGETGFLFEAGNAQALADVLRRAAELPAEKWTAMSAACLKISDEWSVDKWAKRLVELF